MIQHVVKARWVTVVRRIPEMIAANLPLLFVLGLPIALGPIFGYYGLFHWADPSLLDPNDPHFDALIAGKAGYLDPLFFLVRYVVYGLIFSFFARQVYSLSLRQDVEPNPQNTLDPPEILGHRHPARGRLHGVSRLRLSDEPGPALVLDHVRRLFLRGRLARQPRAHLVSRDDVPEDGPATARDHRGALPRPRQAGRSASRCSGRTSPSASTS